MDPDSCCTLTLQCSSDSSVGPREHLRSSLSPAVTFWRTCLRVYLSRDVRCSLMQCGMDIFREKKCYPLWVNTLKSCSPRSTDRLPQIQLHCCSRTCNLIVWLTETLEKKMQMTLYYHWLEKLKCCFLFRAQ